MLQQPVHWFEQLVGVLQNYQMGFHYLQTLMQTYLQNSSYLMLEQVELVAE
jgi:hypothetical protein